MVLSREEQEHLTIRHLKNGYTLEVWLIPYFVTLSILIVAIAIMLAFHWCRKGNKEENRTHQGYNAATTESDEMLTMRTTRDNDFVVECQNLPPTYESQTGQQSTSWDGDMKASNI